MNGSGAFARIEILPSSQKGKMNFICIPVGSHGSGWHRLPVEMAEFVEVAVKENMSATPVRVSVTKQVLFGVCDGQSWGWHGGLCSTT